MILPRITVTVTEQVPSGWSIQVDGVNISSGSGGQYHGRRHDPLRTRRRRSRCRSFAAAAGHPATRTRGRHAVRPVAVRPPSRSGVAQYSRTSRHRASTRSPARLAAPVLGGDARRHRAACRPSGIARRVYPAGDRVAEPPQTLTHIPRVLFAVGARQDDEVIRPGAMFAGLLRAFDSSMVRTAAEASLQQLGEVCAEFRPDIVHLVAHGGLNEDGHGVVRLAGSIEGVGADALLPALTAGGPVRAILLSVCHSGVAVGPASLAAELVAGGIPLVSAMSGEVSVQACRLYTRRFVYAASSGLPAAKAVAQGRRAALLAMPGPGEHLDWAMPTLFASRLVKPDFKLIDPAESRKVLRLANELGLRKHPVFIGRDDILQRLGDLFSPDPDRSLGFIGLIREGSLTRLGGTRLLREIGLSLLRAGHAPVLLGPYDDRNAPTSLRAVVAEIIGHAVKLATAQGASLPVFSLLGSQATDHASVLAALREFREAPAQLDPDIARLQLAEDLAALAERLDGAPFGQHTHVVVLADSLHQWAGAVEDLIAIVRASGLGSVQHPIPVIATYSLTLGMGPVLKTFTENNVGPGFAFPSLGPLTDAEASLGFQWVLLHPWKQDYQKVYVSRDEDRDKLIEDLRVLKGLPERVEEELYMLAQILENRGFLVSADDEDVYQKYESRYP